jgi:hypothetical protein
MARFTVQRNPEPKTDQNNRQRTNRDGAPMWTTQVNALDDTGGEILNITVAGEKPDVTVEQVVQLVGLEVVPWTQNGRHGLVYRASAITPVNVPVGSKH